MGYGTLPRVSVIIPTLNERETLPDLLSDLAGLAVTHQAIVADGGSGDGTPEIARRLGATVLESPPGRGVQLARGAKAASAPLLFFVHADVRLGTPALQAITRLADAPEPIAYVFRLRIDARGVVYRLIEAGANLRSRFFRLPYGDQGLLVRREDYEMAGGYPPEPLMEDVAMIRSLARVVPVRVLSASVTTSARRWQRDGPVRRSSRNLRLLLRYLAGARPADLVRAYPPEAGQP